MNFAGLDLIPDLSISTVSNFCKDLDFESTNLLQDRKSSIDFKSIFSLVNWLLTIDESSGKHDITSEFDSSSAAKMVNIILPKLIVFLQRNSMSKISHENSKLLYSLAKTLAQKHAYVCSLELLFALNPTKFETLYEDIVNCQFKLARNSRSKLDLESAVDTASMIKRGELKVTTKCQRIAMEFLTELELEAIRDIS